MLLPLLFTVALTSTSEVAIPLRIAPSLGLTQNRETSIRFFLGTERQRWEYGGFVDCANNDETCDLNFGFARDAARKSKALSRYRCDGSDLRLSGRVGYTFPGKLVDLQIGVSPGYYWREGDGSVDVKWGWRVKINRHEEGLALGASVTTAKQLSGTVGVGLVYEAGVTFPQTVSFKLRDPNRFSNSGSPAYDRFWGSVRLQSTFNFDLVLDTDL